MKSAGINKYFWPDLVGKNKKREMFPQIQVTLPRLLGIKLEQAALFCFTVSCV